jgi:protein-tyrosine kinase
MSLIERAAARIAGKVPPTEIVLPSLEPNAKLASTSTLQDVTHPNRDGARVTREVIVDRGRLASNAIALPSSERSKAVEEYRIIKHGVIRNAAADPERGRLIMVTSARPREGKTFTSLNLAFSLASERDMRVLVIDCDVHRQTLMATLGIRADRGLLDLLTDPSTDIADVLLRTNIGNITVLPAGKSGPLVPELLSSQKMNDLMNEMVRRYPDRFIILDAPPCLATSDPSVLAGLVGQVLFVVEANRTQEPEIAASLRLISACPSISLVLNKTLGAASDQFGSYSYY